MTEFVYFLNFPGKIQSFHFLVFRRVSLLFEFSQKIPSFLIFRKFVYFLTGTENSEFSVFREFVYFLNFPGKILNASKSFQSISSKLFTFSTKKFPCNRKCDRKRTKSSVEMIKTSKTYLFVLLSGVLKFGHFR